MAKKKFFLSGIVFVSAFLISGCVPSHHKCFKGMEKLGYYCYKGYNYGKDLSPDYKKGIKDGCKTGEGTFTKNYALSSSSADYKAGWDAGRGTCKLIIPEEAKPGMRTEYQQDLDQKKKNNQ